MKRKLPLTVLLCLSAVGSQALALGLGDVEVHSTLDAPLRATIPLTDSAGLEPGLLNVSLADEAAFEVAGLSRTPLAASVEMTIRRRQGQLVLELATDRAVREPWLDLLLRLDWPGGPQLREVTLLLDPPNYDELPALIDTSTSRRLAAASPSPTAGGVTTPPRSSVRSAAADPARVRRGDTLWAVAGRLRPDSGIGMNQMMVALVEANPEAFPSGNIHAMRAGVTLVVPSRDAITARRPADAARLVQAMNRAWANRGSGVPARVPLEDGAGGAAVVAGLEGATAAGGDAPVGAEAEAPAGIPGAVANEAASPRLTLLTEAQAAERGGEAGRGATASPSGEGEPSRDDRLIRLERRWQESRDALAAVQAERDALRGELDALRGELGELRGQLAGLTAGAEGDDDPAAGGVMAPDGEGEAPSASSWWGALYRAGADRPLMLGGAGLAALLALWALVRHRRRREEAPAAVFGEVRVVGPPGTRDEAGERAAMAAASGAAEAPVRASMPQAEAINEADIFIAYGRLDQARELLEAGLGREPERDDLRLKLLGVMLAQGDRLAAEGEAERLGASGDPLIREEAGRLLSRRDAGGPPPAPRDRAVFPAPDERPPWRFDGPEEAAVEASLAEPGGPAEPGAPAREKTAPPPGEPPVSVTGEAGGGERDIIDYRPPTLERDTAPREESPMQPGIAFEPVSDRNALTGAGRRDVEEVAFPPSDEDNASDSTAAASFTALIEARRLLDAGQPDRARALLEDLAEASADPEAREQARELLERHQTRRPNEPFSTSR